MMTINNETKLTAEQRLQRDIERNEAKLRKAEEQYRQLPINGCQHPIRPRGRDTLPAAILIGGLMMNNKTIEQKIQRKEKEITRLEHQKKIKQHEAKQLERNRRNRRIFNHGGMLERFMQRPLLLTDDQVYRLLQTAFHTEVVKELEKALITEAAQAVIQTVEGADTDAKT